MIREKDCSITLPDGRKLGFAEYGDTYGYPILFFHGQPGNRLFRHPEKSIASSLGVRLICIDRPGFGLSDHQPRRRLLDWAKDITSLIDTLGIGKFSILGFSGGGPYAAACAHEIPGRIYKIGLVSSAAPVYLPQLSHNIPPQLRINYVLARWSPYLLYLSFRLFWNFSRRNPEAFVQMALKQAPAPDRHVISLPEVYDVMLESWRENLRVDSRGYAQDVEILMNDWGFRLKDIMADVYIWQGEDDANTPSSWTQYMANEIPGSKLTLIPNEAHFILFTHWKEILQSLMK